MAKPIAFRGIDAVVKAYTLQGIGPWAIVFGKSPPLFASQDVTMEDVEGGAAQLKAVLMEMRKGGTEARYDLNIYKLADAETEIDEKSKIYRSFPFALWSAEDQNPFQMAREGGSGISQRIDKLEALVVQLCEQREEEGEEEEQEEASGLVGALKSIIAMPEIKQAIGFWAGNMVKKISGMNTETIPGKVAGTDQVPVPLDSAQVEKVNRALEILAPRDPLLGDHLLALAMKPPEIYDMALKLL